jgi:hypothetical protein
MSMHVLTDEQAQWLRVLLDASHSPDEAAINQLILPGEVRDALLEKHFLLDREGWVEVTEDGIKALWHHTFAQKAQSA